MYQAIHYTSLYCIQYAVKSDEYLFSSGIQSDRKKVYVCARIHIFEMNIKKQYFFSCQLLVNRQNSIIFNTFYVRLYLIYSYFFPTNILLNNKYTTNITTNSQTEERNNHVEEAHILLEEIDFQLTIMVGWAKHSIVSLGKTLRKHEKSMCTSQSKNFVLFAVFSGQYQAQNRSSTNICYLSELIVRYWK